MDKNKRRFDRNISDNRPIRLLHQNGRTFYLLPADESKSGMGVIFTGTEPPESGAFYSINDDHQQERRVEVMWIKPLAPGIFRLGLSYLS
ncbi:MAG: hypothetical protein A2293_12755 [Elusimicrobia bacterium RIFOXYB2_FULL_49_7]|nr:MAG: hypothetical protein A2293_12755 [Elusimicrobia bacterium RIFOXYB2_FULL_49_7]